MRLISSREISKKSCVSRPNRESERSVCTNPETNSRHKMHNRIAEFYYESFNFTNFANSSALAKIKASTHSWVYISSMYLLLWTQLSKIANISSERKS